MLVDNLLQDVRNRRKWFLNFAQAKEIHPFVAENWYQIETDNILETKVNELFASKCLFMYILGWCHSFETLFSQFCNGSYSFVP